MSIENLLTLGVAAALLGAAALLRVLVLAALRLFFKLSGKGVDADEPPAEATRSRPRRPHAHPAMNGLDALGRGLIYKLATLGTWMAATGAVLGRAYASLGPRVTSSTRRTLVGAGRGLKTAALVTLASLPRITRVAFAWVNERLQATSRTPSQRDGPVEQPEARVILLDREWDPLTDPLEDEPAASYR